MDERIDFGACCACEKVGEDVRNIVMLPYRGTPGQGWGCFVCGLPPDGASAVVCDDCLESDAEIKYAIDGFAADKKRIPIGELSEPFDHDMSKHITPSCSHEETIAFVNPPAGTIELACLGCGEYIAEWDMTPPAPDWVPEFLRNITFDEMGDSDGS